MKVRYFDECQWLDVGDGMIYQFVDDEGEALAEAALIDGDANLWKFEVLVPDRYCHKGVKPAGIVCSQPAAKKVAEMILRNTIVTK